MKTEYILAFPIETGKRMKEDYRSMYSSKQIVAVLKNSNLLSLMLLEPYMLGGNEW